MKAVIAIDSFKGSLSSPEAGAAAAEGIHRACPDAETVVFPLADGGEGTVEALVRGMNGRFVKTRVHGPLGSPVDCTYGVVGQNEIAVIEMSGAAGITLIAPEERYPLHTTTFGVGEVIRDAISRGCRRFLIGIGGSATNDGGAGMLRALGFDLNDAEGRSIAPGAAGLKDLAVIGAEHAMNELKECEFRIACDVTNPLCGENGCSAVFGPQKGATPETIREMDAWLASYAALAARSFPGADAAYPGSGAAGGMGFAFRTFLNAELRSGARTVMEATGLEAAVRGADIVVTGEGRLDAQTVMGKAPGTVALLAKRYGKPVIAFSGCVSADAGVCNGCGVDAFFPILRRVVTQEEAMDRGYARACLADTAEQVFRLIRRFR